MLADTDERNMLTPDLMLKMYRVAGRCASATAPLGKMDESNSWLRSVFATSDYPCILVKCPESANVEADGVVPTKRARIDHPGPSSSNTKHDLICSVCSEKPIPSLPVASGSKRRSVESSSRRTGDSFRGPTYHLVKPDQVCWVHAKLPACPTATSRDSENHETDEDSEDEEALDPEIDQCIFKPHFTPDNSSPAPSFVNQTVPRLYALNDCYGNEHRSFFVDTLRVSLSLLKYYLVTISSHS